MIENTIKDIRMRCRRVMNGTVSRSMRDKGLEYKLNFGVSLLQLKEIAGYYNPNADLAETLWKNDVRELKILATMLYPIEKFSKERALVWIKEIANQEIREQLCINLLEKLTCASELINECSTSGSESIRATGYWLHAGSIKKSITDKTDELMTKSMIFKDILSGNSSLRNAALLLLRLSGRKSKERAEKTLTQIEDFKESADPIKKEIYDMLSFEFDYYLNR